MHDMDLISVLYLPASHAVHVSKPLDTAMKPIEQFVHLETPADE